MSLKPIGYELPASKWEIGKRATFLVGLENFTSRVRRLNFHDGVVLREAKPHELTYSGEESIFAEENAADHLIELTVSGRERAETQAFAALWIDDFLTALRLLKPGDVRIARVYFYQSDVADSRDSAWWSYLSDHVSTSVSPYSLTRSDSYRLKKIYKGIDKLIGVKGYSAFRRYSTGRSRIHAQDRLIDYWIALESLFSGENESQELTYKYAMRIAHYVGTKPAEKVRLFDDMTKAYGARSKVVHGKRSKVLEAMEILTEEALRASLRRAALDGSFPDRDRLDKLAISGK